jgi:hypothetical protein
MKYKVNADLSLRVRSKLSTTGGEILGQLPNGAVIDATVTGAWGMYDIAQTVNGIDVGKRVGFSSAAYLAPVAPPPVVVPPVTTGRTYILGAHCRDDGGAAEKAVAAGVKLLVCMNGMGKVFVRNLAAAHPDVTIIYRRFLNGALPSPQTMVNSLEVAADDPPNLLYMGINEADGDAGSLTIKTHAEWDTQVATLHNSIRGAAGRGKYLAWSAGHGNPPALDSSPQIQDEMRRYYAPGYNAGLYGMDMHDYTRGRRFPTHPPVGAGIVFSIYYERRWTLFFTHCGFNPKVKNMWSTETGVEAGQGGFAWAGYNEQQFEEWCQWICAEQSTGLPAAGTYDKLGPVVYESPYRGGAIFQIANPGDSGDRWAGYCVQKFLPIIAKYSRG